MTIMECPSTAYELITTAFLMYAKGCGRFDNQPKYIEQTDGSTKILYTKYDNFELSEEIDKEERELSDITGSYELTQIHLGFEYDVQYTFIKKEHIIDSEFKRKQEKEIFEGHTRFNSLPQK